MSYRKRKFKNANPPRSCRLVPSVMEDDSKKMLRDILEACGKNPKLQEADVKYDLKGKNPTISLRSRFYGKHSKITKFEFPWVELKTNPFAVV
jgi:hypothetical protein